MPTEPGRKIDKEVMDSLEAHLGSSCSRESLHDYIEHAYESSSLDLSNAVYGFYQSDIQITNKHTDRISGQNSRSDEIGVGLNNLLQKETSAYSQIIDAEGGFYDFDFHRDVWDAFVSEYSEEVDEVEEAIMGLIHGEYENKDHFESEHPLQEFSQFQKDVLEDMYGEKAEIPLVKRISFDKLANTIPRIDENRYDSAAQKREAVLDQVSAKGGIEIERSSRDSWSSHPSSAHNFASRHAESNSGLMLKNTVQPEDITLSSITTPHLTSEREFLLEDNTQWFSEDDLISIDGTEDEEPLIEAYLWQLEKANL